MTDTQDVIEPFYRGWSLIEAELERFVANATPEQLLWSPSPTQWPIWALIGHLAAARVYWLCNVAGEPGAATTPFSRAGAEPGWEDDPGHPRSAGELAHALKSSWAIVDRCLQTWSPRVLGGEILRERRGSRQVHTRQLILMRLLSHDAFHSGEVSQVLGKHGLEALDPWLLMHKQPR